MSRQAATPAATLSAVMLKNIDNQTIDGEEKSKPEVIKLGLDLHARQVTECRQLDGSTPKPAQQWDPWKLLDKVEEWVKAGIKVYSCYDLLNLGTNNRFGNGACTSSQLGAPKRPNIRWYRSFPPL